MQWLIRSQCKVLVEYWCDSRKKLENTCLVTPDVVGAGPLSDNNFLSIASFVSILHSNTRQRDSGRQTCDLVDLRI